MKLKLLGKANHSADSERFFRTRLSNGIRVVGNYRPTDTATTISFVKGVGSGNDPANLKGLNHLIEHVAFIGKEAETERLENKGSIMNAWTDLSWTGHYITFREQDLEDNVNFLCSFLRLDDISKKRFNAEKEVVLEEVRVYHDNPAKSPSDIILPCLFESPFGQGVLGNNTTLSRIDLDLLRRHFEEGLNPHDFIVSFVGNTEPRKLIKSLEDNLVGGDFIKSPEGASKPIVQETKRHSFEVRKDLDQAHMVLGIHSPNSLSRLNASTHVLNNFLTVGISSPLYQRLAKSGKIYSLVGEQEDGANYGLYHIYLGTSSEPRKVGKLIREVFGLVQRVDKKKLDAIKERMIASLDTVEMQRDDIAIDLAKRELNGKGAESFFNRKGEIEGVNLADFRYIARRLSDYQTAVITPGSRSKKEYKATRLF